MNPAEKYLTHEIECIRLLAKKLQNTKDWKIKKITSPFSFTTIRSNYAKVTLETNSFRCKFTINGEKITNYKVTLKKKRSEAVTSIEELLTLLSKLQKND